MRFCACQLLSETPVLRVLALFTVGAAPFVSTSLVSEGFVYWRIYFFSEFLGCRGENTLGPDVAAILGVGSSNNETNTTTTTTTGTTSTPVIATTAAPFSGHHFSFNYTGNDQFCILMDVSTLELEITYPTWVSPSFRFAGVGPAVGNCALGKLVQ